jgi:hypothetical protein
MEPRNLSRRRTRTALILWSIVLMFFLSVIARHW